MPICLVLSSCFRSDILLIKGYEEPKPIMIEVNNVPFPFDLNGNNPYVIWMNGKRVVLPSKEVDALVSSVGEENIPDINSSDIHKGWLFPHHFPREEENGEP